MTEIGIDQLSYNAAKHNYNYNPTLNAVSPAKRIGLSVDEWNVWRYREHQAREDPQAPFRRAPALAEDEQDLADALAVGCLLITLLRHADRVRIACLAQLVNVIPVIRTVDGGPAWRQTTFYPFADVARLGRGTVLSTTLETPTYAVGNERAVDAIGLAAVVDGAGDRVTVFAVNRIADALDLEVVLHGLRGWRILEHGVLTGPDLSATNTALDPLRVVPADGSGATLAADRLRVALPGRSWNVLHLGAS